MPRTILNGHTRFVLLDTNVAAGYYLPESLTSRRAQSRINCLVEAVRLRGAPEVFLQIPNLCIVELFAVLAKYCFATWDRQVEKNLPGGLHQTKYKNLRKRVRHDLHNGMLIQQVELDRYHVLATDLISAVDAHFEHYRHHRGSPNNRQKRMMQAADHAIIGVAIHLSRIHGRDNFALVTADHRLSEILRRARSVNPNTAKKLGLVEIAQELGLKYSPDIYPYVINLASAKDRELEEFFGEWPLPHRPPTKRPSAGFRLRDRKLLSRLRQTSGIGRDSLPYSQTFEEICKEFEKQTKRTVDRYEAWMALAAYEKRAKKKPKKATDNEPRS